MRPKLKMPNPVVNMNGDEMTRYIWQLIIDKLLAPFVELNLVDRDLGLKSRNDTDDKITVEAAEAIMKYGVGVKCATITPNDARMKEFPWLKKKFKSPNGTLRGLMSPNGGAIFRAPIVVPGVYQTYVRSWTKPIIVARHPYGDVYNATELSVPAGASVKIVVETKTGVGNESKLIHAFDCPGIVQVQFNLEPSIRGYAKMCVAEALEKKLDLWFSAKDTISKIYDGLFRDIFAEEVGARKADFEAAGIHYYYSLIDDAVAKMIKSEGGFLLALKNYDGDVQSDSIAQGFGSLGMMTSYLDTPNGIEYEAAHGTVQQHWYAHERGQRTSTNSVASIFAWTGGLRKRGQLDGGTSDLPGFADALEAAVIDSIKGGKMTGDLCILAGLGKDAGLTTEGFIDAVADRLAATWK